MKKKILSRALIVSYENFFEQSSGGAQSVGYHHDRLKSEYDTVDVLICKTNKNFDDRNRNKNLKFYDMQTSTFAKLIIFLWSLIKLLPYRTAKYFWFGFPKMLIEQIERNGYDLVLIEDIYTPAIKIQKDGTEVLFVVNNDERDFYNACRDGELFWPRRIFYHIQSKLISVNPASIYGEKWLHFISQLDRVSVEDQCNFKLKIRNHKFLEFCLNKTYRPRRLKKTNAPLLFNGSMLFPPNFTSINGFFACDEFKRNKDLFSNHSFVITGQYKEQHKIIIEKLAAFEITFTGHLSRAELLSYYSRSHAFLPIFSGSGVQLKVLDLLEHNVPVTCSRFVIEALPKQIGAHLNLRTADNYDSLVVNLIADIER